MAGRAGARASRTRTARPVRNRAAALAGIVAVAVAVLAYLSYSALYQQGGSFQDFKARFNSASNVGIYINYTNSTTYQPLLSCATYLIQELTGPTPAHRNSTSISLFVIYNNSRSCVYTGGRFGYSVNYSNATAAYCLNLSAAMPSIFFAYNAVNSTSVANGKLYLSGDRAFMNYCGIAYQIV